MFGFFRKRMRQEHLRLVRENLRMAAALKQIDRQAGMSGYSQAWQSYHKLKFIVEALEEAEVWLDHHDHLTLEMADDMLELYKCLSAEVAEAERGRAAFRRVFGR